jgi:hypothetical protein
VKTQLTLTRPDGTNAAAAGNRGAPVPWTFSVATTGMVGGVPDTTPTLAVLRLTSIQVRI